MHLFSLTLAKINYDERSKEEKILFEECELTYFCAMVNDSTCLACNASLALPKKGNVERHFMTRHAKYNENIPLGSEARKVKVNAFKSNLS